MLVKVSSQMEVRERVGKEGEGGRFSQANQGG